MFDVLTFVVVIVVAQLCGDLTTTLHTKIPGVADKKHETQPLESQGSPFVFQD